MCGFYYSNLDLSLKQVKSKLNLIKHRGPDNLSIKKVGSHNLGHVRLSNQPIEYKGLYMLYNGEIYNYDVLKNELVQKGYSFKTKSDTEVLLLGYHYCGPKILNKLNGMFSFLIYDSNKDKLFLSRDRTGQKPIYYSIEEKGIEIASQTQCFESKILNQDSISLYLEMGYIPAPYSVYKGVNNLSPGHYIEYDLNNKNFSLVKYWDIPKYKPNNRSYYFNKEKLKSLLEDAVKQRLAADVNVGVLLSSGIDSSLISLISKKNNSNIKTFTIGFENKNFDETEDVKKFVNFFNINNENKILTKEKFNLELDQFFDSFDVPFSDESSLPYMLLSNSAKEKFKVILSGDGSDESFLGYNKFFISFKVRTFFSLPSIIREFCLRIILIFYKRNYVKKKYIQSLRKHRNIYDYIESLYFSDDKITFFDTKYFIKKHYSDSLSRNSYIQFSADLRTKLWLSNSNNFKVDRASMAHSIEARNPFLDYRIIEFSRKIPIKQRSTKKNRKRILKSILKDYNQNYKFSVPKKGFSVPILELFGEEIKEILIKENFTWIKNLNKKSFDLILNEHEQGKIDHSKLLWRFYILHLWKKRKYSLS